jgi:hypothetical protein
MHRLMEVLEVVDQEFQGLLPFFPGRNGILLPIMKKRRFLDRCRSAAFFDLFLPAQNSHLFA